MYSYKKKGICKESEGGSIYIHNNIRSVYIDCGGGPLALVVIFVFIIKENIFVNIVAVLLFVFIIDINNVVNIVILNYIQSVFKEIKYLDVLNHLF